MYLKKQLFVFMLSIFVFGACEKDKILNEDLLQNSHEIYFPTINSDEWKTETMANLQWNQNQLQPLLNFLEQKNTKSFIILYNGKIVVENYFGNHNANSFWYWASAGKTLTATTVGIAQEAGFLNINNKVSDYLGIGWTSIPLEKENLITSKNLLSMTSGLDDGLGDDVSAQNLKYKADAGQRWAYHNVYVKLQEIVEKATNTTWQNYFNSTLRDKIGMNGFWRNTENLSVYLSNTRSMARFGLLIFANGKWEQNQIISEAFLSEATNTSQNINNAYGYLWWLNGKSYYYLPQVQVKFQGSLIPNAPLDLFAGMGKNDQRVYVIPSKKLVIIRMGDAADGSNFALSNFDNELWQYINALID